MLQIVVSDISEGRSTKWANC